MTDTESSTPKASETVSRVSTYLVTNGIKVLGAYIVLKEQSGAGRDTVLIVGALMALGAQTVEAIVLAAIDRFFGTGARSK